MYSWQQFGVVVPVLVKRFSNGELEMSWSEFGYCLLRVVRLRVYVAWKRARCELAEIHCST